MPDSPEAFENLKKIDIPRFTVEQRAELESADFKIYQLMGQTVGQMINNGMRFTTRLPYSPAFQKLTSARREVAINPNEPFIPKSGKRTFAQQVEMLPGYARQVARHIKQPGYAVFIGGAPDYIEIALAHLQSTGERLFGEGKNCRLITTATINDRYIAVVGLFTGKDYVLGEGLRVDTMSFDLKGPMCAPLIIPYSPTDPATIQEGMICLN